MIVLYNSNLSALNISANVSPVLPKELFSGHSSPKNFFLWSGGFSGKPQHQNQGLVEGANGNIKGTLVAWMSENGSKDWTVGIMFVQFSKNRSYHSDTRQNFLLCTF